MKKKSRRRNAALDASTTPSLSFIILGGVVSSRANDFLYYNGYWFVEHWEPTVIQWSDPIEAHRIMQALRAVQKRFTVWEAYQIRIAQLNNTLPVRTALLCGCAHCEAPK